MLLSSGSPRGGSSVLLEGRNESSRLQICAASTSFSATKCTTPDLFICARTPPSSCADTISPVTCLITVGPVMKISPSRVCMMKSVSAGLYAAPPAQGPQIIEICGTTPDSITFW